VVVAASILLTVAVNVWARVAVTVLTTGEEGVVMKQEQARLMRSLSSHGFLKLKGNFLGGGG
jgi:hypothetical protein